MKGEIFQVGHDMKHFCLYADTIFSWVIMICVYICDLHRISCKAFYAVHIITKERLLQSLPAATESTVINKILSFIISTDWDWAFYSSVWHNHCDHWICTFLCRMHDVTRRLGSCSAVKIDLISLTCHQILLRSI